MIAAQVSLLQNVKYVDAFFRVVNECKLREHDSSRMKQYGIMLFEIIEKWERYPPDAATFFKKYCIVKDHSISHNLFFDNLCKDAIKIAGINLPIEISNADYKPVEIANADYKSIEYSSIVKPRTRVLIFQGNLDFNTESYMAEILAEELTKDQFVVDLIFFPLKGHEFPKDDSSLALGNFYTNLDKIFEKYLPFPESENLPYRLWYERPRDMNILGILNKFDFDAIEVLLKLSMNNVSYFAQIFQEEEGLLEKYKTWFTSNSIANAKDLLLTMQMLQKLGIINA